MGDFEYQRWIVAAALAAIRIGASFLICPVFAEAMIPGIARRCVVIAFSALVIPQVFNAMPAGDPVTPLLALIAVKEVLIGVAIGFFASVPFWVAENIGNFIDNQRGATMGEVYSPLSGTQVSSTGIFFTQLVSTIFVTSGAMLLMLGALYASYEIWPVFGDYVTIRSDSSAFMLRTLDGMMRTTVVISSPIIILMFLATIGLGIVNRTAPQLNVFFLSMPIKSAMGIAMLVIYLPYILDKLMYTKQTDIIHPVMNILGG